MRVTNKNTSICITFAGVTGSSKSTITNYISTKINFPVYSNDCLRSEIIVRDGEWNENQFLKLTEQRLIEISHDRNSFILDASVDITWPRLKQILQEYGYSFFIVSLNLLDSLIKKLHKNKNYCPEKLIKQIKDHELFLKNYKNDISLNIYDNNFDNRLAICFDKISKFINSF